MRWLTALIIAIALVGYAQAAGPWRGHGGGASGSGGCDNICALAATMAVGQTKLLSANTSGAPGGNFAAVTVPLGSSCAIFDFYNCAGGANSAWTSNAAANAQVYCDNCPSWTYSGAAISPHLALVAFAGGGHNGDGSMDGGIYLFDLQQAALYATSGGASGSNVWTLKMHGASFSAFGTGAPAWSHQLSCATNFWWQVSAEGNEILSGSHMGFGAQFAEGTNYLAQSGYVYTDGGGDCGNGPNPQMTQLVDVVHATTIIGYNAGGGGGVGGTSNGWIASDGDQGGAFAWSPCDSTFYSMTNDTGAFFKWTNYLTTSPSATQVGSSGYGDAGIAYANDLVIPEPGNPTVCDYVYLSGGTTSYTQNLVMTNINGGSPTGVNFAFAANNSTPQTGAAAGICYDPDHQQILFWLGDQHLYPVNYQGTYGTPANWTVDNDTRSLTGDVPAAYSGGTGGGVGGSYYDVCAVRSGSALGAGGYEVIFLNSYGFTWMQRLS